ncbi:hypothetical protein KKG72_00545 [bacterium]|nr:hypothetical protein [bacterium]
MYRFTLGLLTAIFLVGCGSENSGDATVYHNQGESCLVCHGDSSTLLDLKQKFTSGATVYTSLNASNLESFANGYAIRLVLETTNEEVDYITGNGIGNSHVRYTDTINNYTAQVIDENYNVVNSSTPNSHGFSRLECNSCHTENGINGAPGRITSYDYYSTLPVDSNISETVSFARDVYPILYTSCRSCHTNNRPFKVSNTVSATYDNIIINNFINTTDVNASLLLLKSNGQLDHGGGLIFITQDVRYQTMRNWIVQGGLNN